MNWLWLSNLIARNVRPKDVLRFAINFDLTGNRGLSWALKELVHENISLAQQNGLLTLEISKPLLCRRGFGG